MTPENFSGADGDVYVDDTSWLANRNMRYRTVRATSFAAIVRHANGNVLYSLACFVAGKKLGEDKRS